MWKILTKLDSYFIFYKILIPIYRHKCIRNPRWCNKIRKRNEKYLNWKEEMSLLAQNTFVHVEDSKESTQKATRIYIDQKLFSLVGYTTQIITMG